MTSLRVGIDRINFIVLIYYVISLTLPAAYNSIALILLFVLFLSNFKHFGHNLKSYYNSKKNLLLLIISVALVVSLFYSEDKTSGLKGVLSTLPLIIIPLSLTVFTKISDQKIYFLKKIFVFACFITSLLYLALAIRRSGLIDGSYKLIHAPENFNAYFVSQLTYNHLSPSIHAIFYSLYIALAILIILFEFKKKSVKSQILYASLIIYFLIYNLMLSSITINFALYSFIALYFYFNLSFKKTWHYLVFFGTILIGTAASAYLVAMKYLGPYGDGIYHFDLPDVNKKIILAFAATLLTALIAVLIKLIFPKKYTYVIPFAFIILIGTSFIYLQSNKVENLKENNISVRFKYGQAAINVIKKHPLLGIGIGDKKNTSIMKTEDLPPGAAADHVFNSHNQAFDLWLAAGIIPFICFILFLFSELKKAIRLRHVLYIGLVYCFCLFCLTDSALLAQRGQVFFLFFIWLFELETKRKEITTTQVVLD